MINILQGQRDRYKERLTQAETSIQQLQQKLNGAEAAKTTLEADNVALYSKIRFLQNYSGTGRDDNSAAVTKNYISPKPMRIANTGFTRTSQSVPQQLFGNMRSRGGSSEERRENDDTDNDLADVERHYHGIYEQKMNPFAEVSSLIQLLLTWLVSWLAWLVGWLPNVLACSDAINFVLLLSFLIMRNKESSRNFRCLIG
jgi:hypothetical protein